MTDADAATPTTITSLQNAPWVFAQTVANAYEDAETATQQITAWHPAVVPGTVAHNLRLLEQSDNFLGANTLNKFVESTKVDAIDRQDWWFRCDFSVEKKSTADYQLTFAGLATLADVWLNGNLICQTKNMFVSETVSVSDKLSRDNTLVICFRSNAHFLNQKRPRPQWKTHLVTHQQLRWLRTSLLGYIPGWCPPIVPIGPWQPIQLIETENLRLNQLYIDSVLNEDFVFTYQGELELIHSTDMPTTVYLMVGDYQFPVNVDVPEKSRLHFGGIGTLSKADCWWPHTHGIPKLLRCALVVVQQNREMRFDLGERGFKHIFVNRANHLVELQINKTPIFCRGACWTNADVENLVGTTDSLERSLKLARDAGMNMLRIGGTMVYESDEFYRLCDQLGIMVWQDFMFSNMDYPVHDADFSNNIQREVIAQLNRLSQFACVSVYCGGNEVQQQSAMMGQARAHWSNDFFDSELPALCAGYHAGIPYFPSSPCEGALPFSVSEGISHYYGVGAYKRPLQDAVIAQVKFATECLGFSNIPEPAMVDKVLGGRLFMAHHPAWKTGVARDPSAGWDFEDIRDFYLSQLFALDAVQLRSHDPERYLALARVISGELMLRTLANFRAASHPCRGALIWFYKDLLPGAGWGLVDSDNQPKAAYYAVKRANANLAVFFIDKGLDGLYLNLINETASPRAVKILVKAYKYGHIETLSISRTLTLSRAAQECSLNEWLGYFADLNYSFGFGAPQQDIVYVCMEDAATGEWLHDDTFFVGSYQLPPQTSANISISVISTNGGDNQLEITSDAFLQFVRLDMKEVALSDNYFHLAPHVTRRIRVTAHQSPLVKLKGYLEAINLISAVKF